MTISLNRSQPAVMSRHCTSRVVPAATVWEPAEAESGVVSAPTVRRLEPCNRTHRLTSGESLGSPEISTRSPEARGMREATQAYLVGGLFGLSLVIGTMLAGPSEDPVTATPTEQFAVSAG